MVDSSTPRHGAGGSARAGDGNAASPAYLGGGAGPTSRRASAADPDATALWERTGGDGTGSRQRTRSDLPPLPPELDPRRGRPQRRSADRADAGPREPRYHRADPPRPHGAGPRPPAGRPAPTRPAAPQRGLPGWAALLVLVAIAGVGGIIDTATDVQVRGGFNIGIVVASVVAILVVRRSSLLLIVLAPPIVYSGAAMMMLYIRSGGLHNRDEVINAALNYLVYGFPAIATATVAVLLIAAVRQFAKR